MKPRHYCGIFGAIGSPEAARQTFNGLYALQHRGQESSGIVSTDGAEFYSHKGMGLVPNVYNHERLVALKGSKAVGHNRYSTTGDSGIGNAQPISIICKRGHIAIAHNGNLTNTEKIKESLVSKGAVFQTTTDSEIMLHLIAMSDRSLECAITDMMSAVEGAYSLVIMTGDKLIALRDPHGFRPLSIGRIGSAVYVASETCAFDAIGAIFERDVEAGEIIVIGNDGVIHSLYCDHRPQTGAFCSFEAVYFARPDSKLFGRSVSGIRMAFGARLAHEHPLDADIVVPIPDSGTYAALGYSRARGIPIEMAFVRNHYTGRTFINPDHGGRPLMVNMKLNLIPEMVSGKRVILVDDSIVRGTTSRARCIKLREAGAHEVHMLISCPPHMHPCLYGINFPDRKKLIAATHSLSDIVKELGLDSLGYLSQDGMAQVIHGDRGGLCMACFDGRYPTTTPVGF